MGSDKYYDADKFDQMLRDSLSRHREAVRSGFTGKVLNRICKLEEQKLLARIVLQERLALACCIAMTVFLLAGIVYFGKTIAKILADFLDNLKDTVITFQPDWELILVAAVTVSLILYCFSDSLNLKQLARKLLS
jgi:hypothetical protein